MALKNLDVVLAFAAVMLILSLIITTIVQIVVNLLGLRGRNLVWGVSRLFQQVDPAFKKNIADELSRKLLQHPAVARSFGRATQAISKEEFVRLANDMAVNEQVNLTAEAKSALQAYLNKTVLALSPGQQLALAAAAGAVPAEAAAAVNDAVTKVTASVQKLAADTGQWFDTVLDRTRDTFVLHTRFITAAVAVLVAFSFHVDSLYLFRQLSTNDDARNRIVQSAQATLDKASQSVAAAPGQPAAQTSPPATAALEQSVANLKDLRQELDRTSLQIIPAPEAVQQTTFGGMLITAIFLSLGAPFWFNALRELSSLRPAISQVVDPKNGGSQTTA